MGKDARKDYSERCYHKAGEVNGFTLHVTFTMRGKTFRIISARHANACERIGYYEEKA